MTKACVRQPSGGVWKGGEAASTFPGEQRLGSAGRHHSLVTAISLAKNTREGNENVL